MGSPTEISKSMMTDFFCSAAVALTCLVEAILSNLRAMTRFEAGMAMYSACRNLMPASRAARIQECDQ